MKQLLIAAVLVLGLSASAQEIGTEIAPVTPSSGAQTPPPEQQPQATTPPPSQPKPGGYVYRPQGKGGSTSSPSTPAEPTWQGPKASAASGDFGIRAGFGASGSIAAPSTAAAVAAYSAPTVGIAYFGSDSFKLLVDLGVGFNLGVSSGNMFLGASALLGFDYLFRTPADALRPFFHLGANFSLATAGSDPTIGFGLQVGFGAEYFLNPSFSLNGRMLLALPMAVPGGDFVIGAYTLTPGVGATWYF